MEKVKQNITESVSVECFNGKWFVYDDDTLDQRTEAKTKDEAICYAIRRYAKSVIRVYNPNGKLWKVIRVGFN